VNRSTIRTLLRRNIQETAEDNWSDTVLNELINVAYGLVRKEVRRVDREALVAWDLADIVSGTQFYEKPSGTWGPLEINLLDGGEYKPIRRVDYDLTRPNTFSSNSFAPTFSNTVWFHRGKYIGLYPIPTESITDGIQFVHSNAEMLADDNDVPSIHVDLHYAIVLWATILAKGETKEDLQSVRASLQAILGDIGLYYGRDESEMEAIRPQVEGTRRGGINQRIPNDIV
jgi:hypothetical protein